MTYKEFLSNIKNYIGIKDGYFIELKGGFYPSVVEKYQSYHQRNKKINKFEYKEALYFSCYAGGVSGGSCWDEEGEDNHYHTTSDEEISYEELDSLLEKLCPKLSFLEYRKIQALLSDTATWTENEYYGNYSEYEYQTLDLKSLYNLLIEMGYLK